MAQWFDYTANDPVFQGKKPTIETLMAAWGLLYNPSDPYAPAYKAAIDKARPYGGKAPYAPGSNWDLYAEMCLRARALYFAEVDIGDCGSPYRSQSGGIARDAAIGLNVTGQVAQIGGEIGGLAGISGLANIAGSVLKALPVIGSIVGAFTSIFGIFGANHAAAVANEKKILCAMTEQLAPYIDQIYGAMDSGGATKAQAVAAMQSLAAQFKSTVSSIWKDCNDSCGMGAIMDAHVAFISSLPEPSAASQALAGVFGSSITASIASIPTWAILLIVALVVLVLI